MQRIPCAVRLDAMRSASPGKRERMEAWQMEIDSLVNNWQVNPKLVAGDFQFKAPEGAKVVTVEEFRKAAESKGE